jgi:ADP-ribose pyrophosphatase
MKTLSKKTVFTSRYFKIFQKVVENNGKTFTKDFIEKNPAVLVIPYTEKNEIYLESQYRSALEKVVLELVAGNMEIGEDPLETAKRELLEEAGLTAKKWKKLNVWNLSANMQAEIHVFAATDLEEGEQNLDSDEEITMTKLPLDTILKKIEDGKITIAYQIAALLLFNLLRKEGKL